MDFIEIRFDRGLPVDRDDVEDELNEALAGVGEVSGAGSGAFGAHLDVDIDPGAPRDEVVDRVLGLLSRLGLAGLARIRPGGGTEWIEAGAAWNSGNERGPGASSAAASPRYPHGREMRTVEWIDSGGGPLIAVPESVLGAWKGADDVDEEADEFDEEAGDYGRACAVDGYAGAIDVGGTAALVLGDAPAPTAFLPEHSLFVRRVAADSEEAARAVVGQGLEVAEWEEPTDWDVPGPVVLFDSAYSAEDLDSTGSLRIDLAPGRYRVESAYVEPDDDTWLVLIRLTVR